MNGRLRRLERLIQDDRKTTIDFLIYFLMLEIFDPLSEICDFWKLEIIVMNRNTFDY